MLTELLSLLLLWMSNVTILKGNLVRSILYSIALLGFSLRNPALPQGHKTILQYFLLRTLRIKNFYIEAFRLLLVYSVREEANFVLFFHIDNQF